MVVQVNSTLCASAAHTFAMLLHPATNAPGRVFAMDFSTWKMVQELVILDMPACMLMPAWEQCMQDALTVKVTIGEVVKVESTQVCAMSWD